MTAFLHHARARLRQETGIAIPIALAVMMITLALAGVATAVAIDTNGFSNRDTFSKQALEAANAGLRTAIYRLNQFKPDSNYCPTVPTNAPVGSNGLCPQDGPDGAGLGNGENYNYWVSRLMQSGDTCAGPSIGNSQQEVAQRCVTSIGSANGVNARVQERVVAYTSTPVFPTAIFGTKSVTISNNVNIISDTASSPALLGTNGVLTVGGTNGGGTTVIDGYQLPPGASYVQGQNVTNNGPTTGIANPYPTPTSIDPGTTAQNTAAPYDLGTTSQGGTCSQTQARAEGWAGSTWVQTNCDYRVSRGITFPGCLSGVATVTECDTSTGSIIFDPTGRTLYLGNNATLVLGGGYYNFCSLYLSNNSQITVATGAQASIFIDAPNPSDPNSNCATTNSAQGIAPGTFTMQQNSSINAGGSALNAQIYVFGDPNHTPPVNAVNLTNNASSSFALVAPFSNVTLNPSNNTTFHGAIVGYTVTIGNAAHFTYEADSSSLQSGSLQRYYPSYWKQCPAQPSNAGDPTSGC